MVHSRYKMKACYYFIILCLISKTAAAGPRAIKTTTRRISHCSHFNLTLRGGNSFTPVVPPNSSTRATHRSHLQGYPSSYEKNSNCIPPHDPIYAHGEAPSMTVGELESGTSHPIHLNDQAYSTSRHFALVHPITNYASQLLHTKPALAQMAATCVAVFCAWQVPSAAPLLSNYFVCSRRNVAAGRWTSLLLSAVSHSDLLHLFFNLLAMLSLGPKVQMVLEQLQRCNQYIPWVSSPQLLLWLLMIGAALAGSIAYLTIGHSRTSGGCMGLSAVTMSLLAVYAQAFPHVVLQTALGGLVPMRLPAYQLLQLVLALSAVGSLVAMRSPQSVAHSAHLGGLLFGLAYYKLLKQGWRVPHIERWRNLARTAGTR